MAAKNLCLFYWSNLAWLKGTAAISLFLSLPPVQQAAPAGEPRKTAPILTSDHLTDCSIWAQEGWRQAWLTGALRYSWWLRLARSRWPPSVRVTDRRWCLWLADLFTRREKTKKTKKQAPPFGLSAEETSHNNTDFFQLGFCASAISLLTRSIAAIEVIQSKHLEGSAGF